MNRPLLAFAGLLNKAPKAQNKACQKQHELPRLNAANCKRSKMSHKNVIAKAKIAGHET